MLFVGLVPRPVWGRDLLTLTNSWLPIGYIDIVLLDDRWPKNAFLVVVLPVDQCPETAFLVGILILEIDTVGDLLSCSKRIC